MIRKFLLRKSIVVAAGVVSLAVLFTACMKDKNDVPQSQVSALMAFNLVTDQPAVSVGLSGNLLGAPLNYGNFTGTYLNIYSGTRQLSAYNGSNTLLDSTTYTFEPGKYYSVFVTGTNNNYKNVVVQDNYDSLKASSGKAYVRYVNAIAATSASTVSISSGEGSLVNNSASPGQVSPFIAVTPGSLNVNVSNGTSASRTINVAQQKAYTILLMGQPNQTDTTKAVQIRFIENGTVRD
ncbi:MAG: DUF4397 domain-containing protein [Flavisolibacter sp.]|nr:DUF4397 domain-containing protein [Flavisolibacter sp.]